MTGPILKKIIVITTENGMQSFHGYPLVIRTGGLLNAFGPEVGKKVVHPQTGQVTIQCPGFNRKNKYDR